MDSRNKLWPIIRNLIVVACLMWLPADASAFEAVLREPISLPPKAQMNLLGFFGLRLGGRDAGSMAIYDDAATKRIGDYSELYNPEGNLLAIVWFDSFGILRSLVDRGLILNIPPEGVFVLVLDGEAT